MAAARAVSRRTYMTFAASIRRIGWLIAFPAMNALDNSIGIDTLAFLESYKLAHYGK